MPCTCIACLIGIAISDVGTRDYTAYCAVNDAFKFRERFGDKEIIHYINKLARDGGELIVSTTGQPALDQQRTDYWYRAGRPRCGAPSRSRRRR